jgi:hypothetical protein
VNLGSPQPIPKHRDRIETLRHIGRLSTEQLPKDPLIPLGLSSAGVLAKDGISDPVVFEMACGSEVLNIRKGESEERSLRVVAQQWGGRVFFRLR